MIDLVHWILGEFLWRFLRCGKVRRPQLGRAHSGLKGETWPTGPIDRFSVKWMIMWTGGSGDMPAGKRHNVSLRQGHWHPDDPHGRDRRLADRNLVDHGVIL